MNDEYIPIINKEREGDRLGRDIYVAVKKNHWTHSLPKLNEKELVNLRNEINNFLNNS